MTSSGPSLPRPALSVESRQVILKKLVEGRILKVYLTGGEPMILPDFWDILETFTAAGIFVELTTNGTLLTAENCRRLQAAKLSSLQVSLNGPNDAVNTQTMGPSFDRIFEGVKRAVAAGLSVHVRPTVMAENIESLPDLIRLLAAVPVAQIDFREVTPLGRAATNFSGRRPSPEALATFEEFCRQWKHPHTQVGFESWTLAFEKNNQPASCTLGGERPATVLLDEAGNLAACSATFYLGWENSLLDYELLEAWDRLKLLARFRNPDSLTGACASCEIVSSCQGGCRAAAARLTGDVHAPDPLCPRIEDDIPKTSTSSKVLWKIP